MCLLVIAWQQHADFPLIAAGNRDEYHARPTQQAHHWPDQPDIVAGRDLQAGGSWFAAHRNGRFATITNFRDSTPVSSRLRSRGHLVTEFLLSNATAEDYLASIDGAAYAGFNLLVGDSETLAYRSNRVDGVQLLAPGIYALSNALLDTPWRKVLRSKQGMQQLIDDDQVNETQLLRLLDDRTRAPADEIDNSDRPFAIAHAISAAFIVMPDYGTRCSSVALQDKHGAWRIRERRFNNAGIASGDSSFTVTPQE